MYKRVFGPQWARQASIPSQLMQGHRHPQSRLISMKPSRHKLVTTLNNLAFWILSISKINLWPLLTCFLSFPPTAHRRVTSASTRGPGLQSAFNALSLVISADLGLLKRFVLFPRSLSSSPSPFQTRFGMCAPHFFSFPLPVSTYFLTSFHSVSTLPLATNT